MMIKKIAFALCCLLAVGKGLAQSTRSSSNPIYVDADGVMRWTDTRQEASFFGVNYTTPFAYAFRAHQRDTIDMRKAIDDDVYHMARLGLNAFRIHVWDTEISDSLGNLIENEHMELFDYLLSKLKERGIYTLITPIAFWGNGWPEKDFDTPGFSHVYGRDHATTNRKAVEAQERYIRQFFLHINPHTGLRYADDPSVIGVEINNEPVHKGEASDVTDYISTLVHALRESGWEKPIFYNISQNPSYAKAVAASPVDGFTFQWYPLGLVANRTINGNFLPHVDRYHIPYDSIPAFHRKARLIYEFDAADQLQSIYYPAMARSFRTAGFQWATQFAYDPMYIAHTNSEYPTHYLNLAYTPAKAISLMIAARAFHDVARGEPFGQYPADSIFGSLRLSYKQSISEMNTATEFYYTDNTDTKPQQMDQLEHVAGVGSSPVVIYEGTGAYFLDKLQQGLWRLEVMPDVNLIKDPFGRNEIGERVADIHWQQHKMKVLLADLNGQFAVEPLDEGNRQKVALKEGTFHVTPGTYLLKSKDSKASAANLSVTNRNIKLHEFAAPASTDKKTSLFTMTEKVTTPSPELFRASLHSDLFLYPAWHPEIKSRQEVDAPDAGLRLEYMPGEKSTSPTLIGFQRSLPRDVVYKREAKQLVLKAKSLHGPQKVSVGLIDTDGQCFETELLLDTVMKEQRVPLASLRNGGALLLPRPYPEFMPLWFNPRLQKELRLEDLDKVQLYMPLTDTKVAVGFMVESIRLDE